MDEQTTTALIRCEANFYLEVADKAVLDRAYGMFGLTWEKGVNQLTVVQLREINAEVRKLMRRGMA